MFFPELDGSHPFLDGAEFFLMLGVETALQGLLTALKSYDGARNCRGDCLTSKATGGDLMASSVALRNLKWLS